MMNVEFKQQVKWIEPLNKKRRRERQSLIFKHENDPEVMQMIMQMIIHIVIHIVIQDIIEMIMKEVIHIIEEIIQDEGVILMIEIVILIEDIIIIINKMYNNLVHFINLFVTMSFLVRSVSKSLLYRSSLTSLSSTIGKRFFATEAEEKEVWDYFLLIRIRIELKCKK